MATSRITNNFLGKAEAENQMLGHWVRIANAPNVLCSPTAPPGQYFLLDEKIKWNYNLFMEAGYSLCLVWVMKSSRSSRSILLGAPTNKMAALVPLVQWWNKLNRQPKEQKHNYDMLSSSLPKKEPTYIAFQSTASALLNLDTIEFAPVLFLGEGGRRSCLCSSRCFQVFKKILQQWLWLIKTSGRIDHEKWFETSKKRKKVRRTIWRHFNLATPLSYSISQTVTWFNLTYPKLI